MRTRLTLSRAGHSTLGTCAERAGAQQHRQASTSTMSVRLRLVLPAHLRVLLAQHVEEQGNSVVVLEPLHRRTI